MIKTYYFSHEDQTVLHDVDLNRLDHLLASPESLLWIDLYDCTASELHHIGDLFGFHPLALEDCLQESPRAKLDRYDDYYFFVFHGLRYFEEAEEEDEITSIELDVFLGPNYIVTIHPVALTAVGKVARVCLKEGGFMDMGSEHLLYRIVDNMVDEYFPIVDRLGERIDDLEDSIFIKRGDQVTEEILALKTTIILLRKVLIPQRRIFGSINGYYSFLVNEENRPYYLDLVDHMDSILDTTNAYRDLVNSSTETYYSIINGRTSEIITVLTIISIVMMPLTVITSFYGMNLIYLPGAALHSFVWYLILGMGVLVTSMLLFFRYRRWI